MSLAKPSVTITMSLPVAGSPFSVDLHDRVVLVTGASGGLGRAIAKACAQNGATVILHGRVVRKLEALYDEIVAQGLRQPTILPLDFAAAGTSDFDHVSSSIQSQLGRLDSLVHTAAMLGSLGPIDHQTFDVAQKVFRVNVLAAMALTRALMPLLSAASDASVVFTLDSRGQMPRAYWGAYAASKAALAAIATTLADECEQRMNIRINAAIPGPMRSPLRLQTHPGEDRSHLPQPDAMVALYLHLIAGQAKVESGCLIEAQPWLRHENASTSLVPPPLSDTAARE
jgi:NAD(P)-dependent dehydrogenase (short-subunit alcohol dehydrogenase family)